MDWDFYLDLVFYICVCVCVVSYIVLIIAKSKQKKRISNIAECVMWWLVIPIVMPFRAKKTGLIKKQIFSWLLILISPVALYAYLILFVLIILSYDFSVKLKYEDLPIKTHHDIALLTEISNFPEVEYLDNSFISKRTSISFKFKNQKEIETLIQKLDNKILKSENIFWSKDKLYHDKDKEQYGCEDVYRMVRGWDTLYVQGPRGIKVNNVQVEITIGRKEINLIYSTNCAPEYLDFYSNCDSLSALFGVKFPKYKIGNLWYSESSDTKICDATLVLENKPSKSLINSIKSNPDWENDGDGRYFTYKHNKSGKYWSEFVCIDPNSRLVEFRGEKNY